MPFTLLLLILFGINISITTSAQAVESFLDEPISPIPLQISLNPDKIALGKKLFEDPFLSHDGNQSCSQCHRIDQGGVDNMNRSETNQGEADVINTPTIFNVAFNVRYTWRGQFKTLEMQAQGDLHNSLHANTTWDELLAKLNTRSDYVSLFIAIYSDKTINKGMVLDAIAIYEKSLITPNSPFDKYLRGEKNAISLQAKKGYQLFKSYGCIACHQGINIGGNMFQKMGVFGDYFKNRQVKITKADYGRFNVTGFEQDRYVFRVPSLRNIDLTFPYFHDGKTETLKDAIDIMAEYQLGRKIPAQDNATLIFFLKTLTGEYKGKLLSRMPSK